MSSARVDFLGAGPGGRRRNRLGDIHAVIARLREIVLSQRIDKVRKRRTLGWACRCGATPRGGSLAFKLVHGFCGQNLIQRAGRGASATRGAAATGTARAGSGRRDRKRCAYIAKGPKLGLDVGGRRVELCCAVVVPRSFQKPRLVQDGVPDSKRRAVLAHDVTDGQQSLRPPLAVH